MPAGIIGSCWRSGTWSDTAWEAGSWADGATVVLLPANIIKATQTVVHPQRRIQVTHSKRTVTFDG